jgi:hypothetical protein
MSIRFDLKTGRDKNDAQEVVYMVDFLEEG